MLTFGERLKWFIKAERLSNREFGEMIGISPTSVNGWTTNTNKPNLDALEKIFTVFPHLNKLWLLDGTGEMTTSQDAVTTQSTTSANVKEEISMLRKLVKNLEYIVELQRNQLQSLGKLFDVLQGQFFSALIRQKLQHIW